MFETSPSLYRSLLTSRLRCSQSLNSLGLTFGDPLENVQVPMADAGTLLASVTRIGEIHAELAARRKEMLLALAEVIGADAGLWAWGRGRPDSSLVVPVAQINFGMSDEQRTVIMDAGLDAEMDREFRGRILVQMGDATHATTIRDDIYTAQEWEDDPAIRRFTRRGGWASWLHSVRYSVGDTWSNFLLLRNVGGEEFGRREAALAHLVLNDVHWMHATSEEILPATAFIGLTPRRRAVMLMILDGMSRKEIASGLKIAEDTVGDHIKAIYSHFDVGGASQLAALFLRNQ